MEKKLFKSTIYPLFVEYRYTHNTPSKKAELLKSWYEISKIRNCDTEKLVNIIIEIKKDKDRKPYFPSTQEILKRICDSKKKEEVQRYYKGCKICEFTGLISIKQTSDVKGIDYDYLYRCKCDKGAQLKSRHIGAISDNDYESEKRRKGEKNCDKKKAKEFFKETRNRYFKNPSKKFH
jgi:hypothetical protein